MLQKGRQLVAVHGELRIFHENVADENREIGPLVEGGFQRGDLGRRLRRIVDDGVGMLLVDHDMSLVLAVCDYVYVLEFGRLIAEGPPERIRTDDRVITAYLGERAGNRAETVLPS